MFFSHWCISERFSFTQLEAVSLENSQSMCFCKMLWMNFSIAHLFIEKKHKVEPVAVNFIINPKFVRKVIYSMSPVILKLCKDGLYFPKLDFVSLNFVAFTSLEKTYQLLILILTDSRYTSDFRLSEARESKHPDIIINFLHLFSHPRMKRWFCRNCTLSGLLVKNPQCAQPRLFLDLKLNLTWFLEPQQITLMKHCTIEIYFDHPWVL